MNLLLRHIFLFSLFLGPNWAKAAGNGPVPARPSKVYPLPSIQTQPGQDSGSCVISFNRAGNLILIRAKIDTLEGNFILDTGAPNLVLNITYFRDYPVRQLSDAEQTSITGSTPTVSKTTIHALSFGSFSYEQMDADLANLGLIENSKGIKILGLLGMNLFRRCEMIIDYEKNLIYLHRIGKKESSDYKHEMLKDATAYTELPIELMDNRILTTLEMDGKKLKFVVDCAAESNVLDSRLPNKIFDHVAITGRTLLGGAGTKKVEALKGNVSGLKIGNQDIASFPVLITNLEKTCFSYSGCIDGILGFDFLALHKIGFNFVNRKMYIWK